MKITRRQLRALIKEELIREELVMDDYASIELDWAGEDMPFQYVAREYHIDAERVGTANGFPVVKFTGPKDQIIKLIDGYCADSGEDPDYFYEQMTPADPEVQDTTQLDINEKLLKKYPGAEGALLKMLDGFRVVQDGSVDKEEYFNQLQIQENPETGTLEFEVAYNVFSWNPETKHWVSDED